MYIFKNNNPSSIRVGDCVIRAISEVTGLTWERVYLDLAIKGYLMHDMPSSNNVWGSYLHSHGFRKHIIPDTCPACYTVIDFTIDHPIGKYILATGTHVIAVINGDYIDTWDSGDEVPIYYWRKR
jgi:hypothetical protein